jgi:hypothetical protein
MPRPRADGTEARGQKHSLKNRFRADPRSQAQRDAEGTPRRPAPRRDREYYCSCGVSFGNVIEGEARRAYRQHTR